MLASIGVEGIDELFLDIPPGMRLKELDIPAGISEPQVLALVSQKAEENAHLESRPSFLGGGAYFGYVPAAVGAITGRAEFYTSYTPYQAELSQGTLQVIYEFQSMIAMLTGLSVANASLYDGATAVAEAASMSLNATGRDRIAIVNTVNPEYGSVLRTYAQGIGYGLDEMAVYPDGEVNLGSEHAALIVQNPDYLGSVVSMKKLAEQAHEQGALFIAVVDPVSLAILAPPGAYGADIAVGEGQNLGNWLSYGGPYLGFIAATPALQRRMPGRIAGASVDDRGNRAYVLTLQAREQHIRRERATSNICTNEALVALAATVYLSLLGSQGLRKVANVALQKAHYAAERLGRIPGFEIVSKAPFFREFALRTPVSGTEINRFLLGRDILGGIDVAGQYPNVPQLANSLLLAFTDQTSKSDIDDLVNVLTDFTAQAPTQERLAVAGGVQ